MAQSARGKARGDLRRAKQYLMRAFTSDALEPHEVAAVRAAVASINGALGTTELPIGTTGVSEQSAQELDEYLDGWGQGDDQCD